MKNNITPIIKPVSMFCNIACKYCYYNTLEKEFTRMSLDVLDRMFFDFSKLKQNTIKLIWHGGEPLLAGIDFYQEVISLEKKYLAGKRYKNSIQTNGTLINENWIKFFKENNFSVGISLDGPQDIHDRLRKTKTGEGTFSGVMNSILMLQRAQVKVGIIGVINKFSIGREVDIFSFFVENKLKNFNFLPFLASGDCPAFEYSITTDQYSDFMIAIFNEWMKRDDPNIEIPILNNFIQGIIGGRPTLCCCQRDCSSLISIDFNGDLYACGGRFLKNEDFLLGNIKAQNLADIIFSEKRKELSEKFILFNKKCEQCKWQNVCNGGCFYYSDKDETGNSLYHFCDSTKKILNFIERRILEIQTNFISKLVD